MQVSVLPLWGTPVVLGHKTPQDPHLWMLTTFHLRELISCCMLLASVNICTTFEVLSFRGSCTCHDQSVYRI